MVISLSSNSTAIVVPPYVFVPGPGGSNSGLSAAFSITATLVDADAAQNANAAITASYSSTPGVACPVAIAPQTSQLGLTPAGLQAGFTLSTFVSNLYNSGSYGPMGIQFYGSRVYVVDYWGYFYVFPSDVDGQIAPAVPSQPPLPFEPVGLAALNGYLYLCEQAGLNPADQIAGLVVQLDASGNPSATNRVYLPGATGLIADPYTGTLFCSNSNGITTINVDQNGQLSLGQTIESSEGPDGMALSADGGTIYAVTNGTFQNSNIYGFDLNSGKVVFNYRQSNPSVPIELPDGIVLGTDGTLIVNTNTGRVYQVNVTPGPNCGQAQMIADGGSRGDFAVLDPNGSILLVQTDSILRLTPPAQQLSGPPTQFVGLPGGYLVTRDDTSSSDCAPIQINASSSSPANTLGLSAAQALFDVSGFSGGAVGPQVSWEYMQRGGQQTVSQAATLDAQFGYQDGAGSGAASWLPPPVTLASQTAPYTAGGQPPQQPMSLDLQSVLAGGAGQNCLYQPWLVDQVSASCGQYLFTDNPQYGAPAWTAKNTLAAVLTPAGNPQIPAGRTRAITLPWGDAAPVDWQVLQFDFTSHVETLIANSTDAVPTGWMVTADATYPGVAWVTAPASATPEAGYEVRLGGNGGAGFFDVVAAGGGNSGAAVIQSFTISPNPVIGGSSTTGTVTLDAAAPGAIVSICTFSGGITFGGATQTTVAIGSGNSATFEIDVAAVQYTEPAVIFASYNGTVAAQLLVFPPGGGGPAPTSPQLTATAQPGAVTLNWSASTGAASYVVGRSLSQTGPFTPIASVKAAIQTYVDNTVNNGTTYYYQVQAVNIYGSTPSNVVTVPVPDAPEPASFSITPTTVTGGYPAVATVQLLNGAAGSGGESITFTGLPNATDPVSVFIPPGSSQCNFVIQTSPVSAAVQYAISACEGGTDGTPVQPEQITFTVNPPQIVSVTFDPNPVTGVAGATTTGTVVLNGPAPWYGVGNSQNVAADLTFSPAGVVTPTPDAPAFGLGDTTATFTARVAAGVTVSTPVTVTATSVNLTPTSSATGTLVVNPASTTYYVADVQVTPAGIRGGGSAVGTVSLNQQNSTGAAIPVALSCGNSYVQLPGSVTVQPGSQTATFTVGCDQSIGDVEYATVAASYNTWTQAADITLLPAEYSLAPAGVGAFGGDSCVVLMWPPLPDKSVRGYNVYRVAGGTPVLLNTTGLVTAPAYADTGLVNGSGANEYQVTSVDDNGVESAPATGNAGPQPAQDLVWTLPPAPQITGSASVWVSLQTGTLYKAVLLIDGNQVPSGLQSVGTVDALYSTALIPQNTYTYQLSFDSAALANGAHSVQVLACDAGGVGYCTPALMFSSANAFNNVNFDSLIQQDTAVFSPIKCVLPAGATAWTARIVDEHGNPASPSWTGAGPNAQFAWDGRDALGNAVTCGNYTATVTALNTGLQAQDGGTGSGATMSLTAVSGTPYAAAMIDHVNFTNSGSCALENQYATNVVGLCFEWEQEFFGPAPWVVFMPDTKLSEASVVAVVKWFSTGLQVLYMMEHGVEQSEGAMKSVNYDGLFLYPTHESRGDKLTEGFGEVFLLDAVTHPYVFVFLDCCTSAGKWSPGCGAPAGQLPADKPDMWIGVPDLTWSDAFQIQPSGFGGGDSGWFMGWTSEVPSVAQPAVTDDESGAYVFNPWFYYRQALWLNLTTPTLELPFWQAEDKACLTALLTIESMNLEDQYGTLPWDVIKGSDFDYPRRVSWGDLLGTILQP